MDRTKLRGAYARLKGLERAVPAQAGGITADVANDFDKIVSQLSKIIDEDTSEFLLPRSAFYNDNQFCELHVLRSRLLQLISYLEYVHHVAADIIEIGTLFNSIKDEELKSRCADLLSAPANFDRAINQATQVLEDRIRTKASFTGSATGTQLVNALIKANPSESIDLSP